MKTMPVKSLTPCLAHSRPSVCVTFFLLPLHHCLGLSHGARSAWAEDGGVGTWAWLATHVTVRLRSGELESEQKRSGFGAKPAQLAHGGRAGGRHP